MPKKVSINELREGMELADAIKNKFGQVLITSNSVYELKHLRLLKTWGITSVWVKVDSDNNSLTECSDEHRKVMQNLLLNRLKWNPKNSFEQDLLDMALDEICERELCRK